MIIQAEPPSDLAVMSGGDIIEPLAAITPEQIEAAAQRLMDAILSGNLQEVVCPLKHTFTPGVYARKIFMPRGSFIIGQEHKTEHVNIVLSGSAYVLIGGSCFRLEAPHDFVSEAGVRKVLFIDDDMEFMTVHPNPDNERCLERLAERFVVKRPSFVSYIAEIKRLRDALIEPHD